MTRLISPFRAGLAWLRSEPWRDSDAEGFGFTRPDVEAIMADIYGRGDRLISGFLLLHLAFALCLASFYQTWTLTLSVGSCALLMFLVSRWLLPRSFATRCIAGISLQTFVALHIYQMHGLPEMHFTFFTAFTMMIVYQDWRSMWPGALLIIGQHILFAILQNAGVNVGFFPDSTITVLKLAFHFGIALVEVGVCGYWAVLLRRRTLEAAVQERRLSENGRKLSAHLGETQESARALQHQTDTLIQVQQELESTNQWLETQATTDGLTGLKNHRHFQEAIAAEFERARRHNGALSMILLDVDRFKAYNDAFGHPAGDEVLKSLSRKIQSVARDFEIVARYGGEEFVVLLPDTDAAGACHAAERFRRCIEIGSWEMRAITASFGVATLKLTTLTPAELIEQADKALYRAKQRGRNCVVHIEDAHDEDELQAAAAAPYSGLVERMIASQVDSLLSASHHVKETLVDSHDRTVLSWSQLLEMRNKETAGHCLRVAELTERLARSVGLNEDEIRCIRWGALLHDIGKIGLPDRILLKTGPLTEEEWAIVRTHPEIAHSLLNPIQFLQDAIDIPYCHHEKWDGTGYPRGLKGDEIPFAARLFAVVDAWDSLRSDRPFRAAWPDAAILDHLLQQSGRNFDPRAVNAFLDLLSKTSPAPAVAAAGSPPLNWRWV